MSDQLLKTTITIEEIERKITETGKIMFKIKGSDKRSYQVWQFKRNGSDSVAFVSLSNFPNMGNGRTFDIAYREEHKTYNEKPVIYRTIVQAFLNRDNHHKELKEFQEVTDNTKRNSEDDKWNKIAFGKCKHAFLIEAYKLNKEIELSEKEAELWATASMRVKYFLLGKPSTNSKHDEDIFEDEFDEEEILTENIPF